MTMNQMAAFDTDMIAELAAAGLLDDEQIAKINSEIGVVDAVIDAIDVSEPAPEEQIPGVEVAKVFENENITSDELARELELDDSELSEIVEAESVPFPLDTELGEELAADIAAQIAQSDAREALYAAQESTTSVLPDDDSVGDGIAVPPPIVTLKAPRAASATPAAAKAPSAATGAKRAPRIAAGTPGKHAALIAGEHLDLGGPLGGGFHVSQHTETFVDGIKAIKIKEKAVNLLEWQFKGASLSVYTVAGLNELRDKSVLTMRALIARLGDGVDGKVYTDGTARAQAQQVVTLLKLFGVTHDNGDLRRDSPIWQKFSGIAA